ncbi:MAG TPA: hypothetical protein VMK12_27125 [Anaeromyxobacteraceae bacterium]|nr:hypothetical protein [Anaeromyxobacteraceae bacterium]
MTGLALIAGLGLTSCATTAKTANGTQATNAAPSADDRASAELKEHDWHHHRGGVTQFIAMSLDTLGADDAKRPQIEKVQSDLHACMGPSGRIERDLHLTLADGIAVGAIDVAKVDALIERLDGTAATVHDCSVNALNQLHAILSPAERSELAEKVKAHWQVWRHVNHEARAGGRERGGRLAELARELDLTPTQVDKISADLQASPARPSGKFDPGEAEAHVQAFAAAFAADSFDAGSVTPANVHLALHGARRMAHFYETVSPELTAEQRTTLARHLREHATHQPVVRAK